MMTYLYTVLGLFALYVIVGVLTARRLYIGYGFVMSAIRARDDEDNPSAPLVVKVDSALAVPEVLRDGFFNVFYAPLIFLDPSPRHMLRLGKVKGKTLVLPELLTERCSRYSLDPGEWAYRKYLCAVIEPFLGPKDPKGWHLAGAHKRIDWLYGDAKVNPNPKAATHVTH